MSCLLIGALAVGLSGDRFTLEWTHSVERVAWKEEWVIDRNNLQLIKAAIKGSGAGMEPGPNAILQNGWWVWETHLALQSELVLAASGVTPSPWRLCDGKNCRDLGRKPDSPIIIRPCPAAKSISPS
ncbi:MAG: DUF1850 domain-containing protein [Paracoccus sp. (in: a-proteobacteria)]